MMLAFGNCERCGVRVMHEADDVHIYCDRCMGKVLREKTGLRFCEKTGNPCGTDTWMEGTSCPCRECQNWLREHKKPAVQP